MKSSEGVRWSQNDWQHRKPDLARHSGEIVNTLLGLVVRQLQLFLISATRCWTTAFATVQCSVLLHGNCKYSKVPQQNSKHLFLQHYNILAYVSIVNNATERAVSSREKRWFRVGRVLKLSRSRNYQRWADCWLSCGDSVMIPSSFANLLNDLPRMGHFETKFCWSSGKKIRLWPGI